METVGSESQILWFYPNFVTYMVYIPYIYRIYSLTDFPYLS